MEEVRLYEEKKKRAAFEKVEFFRKIKEFTRLNKQYSDICQNI